MPQLWEAVVEVESDGHQDPRGPGGELEPGAELGGAELRDQRGALAAEAHRALATGKRAPRRVEGVLVVQDREPDREPQHLDLRTPPGPVQVVEPVEDLGLVQLVDLRDFVHESSQAPATDIDDGSSPGRRASATDCRPAGLTINWS
ncbi:MAG: hypothetical protein JWO76_1997, partial [Nocardioides sp.]|nr:hypothetical protein [Nocardioides sp.]